MGYLSQRLRDYLSKPHVTGETPVKIVVCMNRAPTTTINRVPRTAAARREAIDALRAAGISGELLSSPEFTPRRMVSGVNLVTMQVLATELERLAASPDVEYVRPERMHRAHLDVSPGLLGVDSGVRTHFDGAGIRVAILDSGIDADHPDLRGRVNLTHSHNFTGEGSATDVTDGNGHGTHVAGIVGGAGALYQGIAPKVEFIACKVFDSKGRGSEGAVVAAVRWATEHGAHVINYSGGFAPVDEFGEAIIPPPWVWPAELMNEEVEFRRAMDSGVVGVISAGNEGELGRRGTLSMPATSPDVVSVGAVDKARRLTSFSSVGPAYRSDRVSHADMVDTLTSAIRAHATVISKVDLVAPGGGVDRIAATSGGCFYGPGIISVLSSVAQEDSTCIVGDDHVKMSGTSQAAPHIAGLAALVLQAAGSIGANLGPRRAYAVKGILRAASVRLTGLRPAEQGNGLPRWDAIESILREIAAGTRSASEFV